MKWEKMRGESNASSTTTTNIVASKTNTAATNVSKSET